MVRLRRKISASLGSWIDAYERGQDFDFIIIGSNAGISDWDAAAVQNEIVPASATLSATNHGWMMPYAMFGMTKVPEEQGEWAGKVAIEILKGTKPSDIPIIPNRNFNIIVNNTLLDYAQIKLPEFIKLKAQPYY